MERLSLDFTSLEKEWTFRDKVWTQKNTNQSIKEVLIDNIKLDGMLIKIKSKIQACFTLYLKLLVILFLILSQFIYQKMQFFNFHNSIEDYLKKIFDANFPFFNGFIITTFSSPSSHTHSL